MKQLLLLGLTLLSSSLLSSNSFAADTSGCTPMIEHTAEQQTRSGALLSVKSLKPRWETCWNVNEAAVEISYRWVEEGANVSGAEVFFWVKINDRIQQVKTAGNCKIASDSGVSKNTGGRVWYDCRATTLAPVLSDRTGRYTIEIAPRKSGYWDTWGFEQNYHFQL